MSYEIGVQLILGTAIWATKNTLMETCICKCPSLNMWRGFDWRIAIALHDPIGIPVSGASTLEKPHSLEQGIVAWATDTHCLGSKLAIVLGNAEHVV